jgi:hypothetical protein
MSQELYLWLRFGGAIPEGRGFNRDAVQKAKWLSRLASGHDFSRAEAWRLE